MANVKNCDLPDELYYNIESNVWARLEADGSLVVGMTSYACALSGEIVAFTPRKPGKAVEINKSVATVESGKWVGPIKAPVAGEVIAVNDEVVDRPGTINADPYGAGWLVRLKPADWAGQAGTLLSGDAARAAFLAKMEADGFGGC